MLEHFFSRALTAAYRVKRIIERPIASIKRIISGGVSVFIFGDAPFIIHSRLNCLKRMSEAGDDS